MNAIISVYLSVGNLHIWFDAINFKDRRGAAFFKSSSLRLGQIDHTFSADRAYGNAPTKQVIKLADNISKSLLFCY